MTDNDGWEFAKWTVDQRWSTDEPVEYFGRSFVSTSNDIYAIRVPTTFTEPLKLHLTCSGKFRFKIILIPFSINGGVFIKKHEPSISPVLIETPVEFKILTAASKAVS